METSGNLVASKAEYGGNLLVKKSINTQLDPDNTSEAIAFKMSSAVGHRKNDKPFVRKVNVPGLFSMTT